MTLFMRESRLNVLVLTHISIIAYCCCCKLQINALNKLGNRIWIFSRPFVQCFSNYHYTHTHPIILMGDNITKTRILTSVCYTHLNCFSILPSEWQSSILYFYFDRHFVCSLFLKKQFLPFFSVLSFFVYFLSLSVFIRYFVELILLHGNVAS